MAQGVQPLSASVSANPNNGRLVGGLGQTEILNYCEPTKHHVVTLKSHVTSKICSMAIGPKEGSDQTSQWQEVGSAPLQSRFVSIKSFDNCLLPKL